MNLIPSAQKLVSYIESLDDFPIPKNRVYSYDHMGAVLTDTILQAGLNYKTVVAPRVNRVINTYPEAKIVSIFLLTIHRDGPQKILNWNHPEKPQRLLQLTEFLYNHGIESETDLHNWLIPPENSYLLISIKGIGPKTVDYLKNLVKISSVAVDRHIRNFVQNAGIGFVRYEDIQFTVIQAAEILDLSPAVLDHAIWNYMSTKLKVKHL